MARWQFKLLLAQVQALLRAPRLRCVLAPLRTLRELHALCSLPALDSLTLALDGYFSDDELEGEGAEGEPEGQQTARVALALARRALPALRELDWAAAEAVADLEGTEFQPQELLWAEQKVQWNTGRQGGGGSA